VVVPILTRTALSTVEVAYSFEGDDRAWLERVLASSAPDLNLGLGVYASTGTVQSGHLLPTPPMASFGLSNELGRLARALHPRLPCPILDAFAPRAVVCGGLDEAWPKKLSAARLYRDGMASGGVVDAFVLFAQDGEGGAVQLIAPSSQPVVTHPRTRASWGRVALHLAAALRLRRRARTAEPVAILDAKGAFVEAFDLAPTTSAKIARAVKQAERARSMRDDPEAALCLWSGLLAGLYSVVDRWESDGRRYVVVYRNDPSNPDPRALGASERQVAELVALGAGLKEAAYALGITTDAVQKALTTALRKLGLARRGDLTSFFAGDRHAMKVRVGDAHLDVLVASTLPSVAKLGPLTSAERDVATSVMLGLANAAIARARGTSTRTVANQVRRVFTKLGVRSRGELRACLAS
jgi:DNA-binding NarL/FixJ family response regulator